MTALLDTHILIWVAADDPRLPAHVRNRIKNRANDFLVSDGSIWEMAVKAGIGKLRFDEGLEGFLAREFETNLYRPLEIRRSHLFRVETLPQIHRDPFDRLLIAQAIEEDLPILTADPSVSQYPVKTVW